MKDGRREHVSITAEDITIEGDLETFLVNQSWGVTATGRRMVLQKVLLTVEMWIDPASFRRWQDRGRKRIAALVPKLLPTTPLLRAFGYMALGVHASHGMEIYCAGMGLIPPSHRLPALASVRVYTEYGGAIWGRE